MIRSILEKNISELESKRPPVKIFEIAKKFFDKKLRDSNNSESL